MAAANSKLEAVLLPEDLAKFRAFTNELEALERLPPQEEDPKSKKKKKHWKKDKQAQQNATEHIARFRRTVEKLIHGFCALLETQRWSWAHLFHYRMVFSQN